ncbi:hypothetical protein P7K49_018873 [Saguinus oedipus]|uniref:Uncharacterized protein n=1 Tax=Saguinus oedipus TaxID=9490 RepID=A0ABQ9V6L6_SAGOE|nr:hypothetical protein P7K49_018873 [Saguinus oedipus]
MKRPLSRCSDTHRKSEKDAPRSPATPRGPRRCRRRRPARSREEAWTPTRRRRRARQPKRRKEELEAELREQETELKGLRKQSEIPPQLLSERLCRREAPGGRERMKTRKTERKRPQRHLEVEANSFPQLLDRKSDDLPDFRSGLPMLSTNSKGCRDRAHP